MNMDIKNVITLLVPSTSAAGLFICVILFLYLWIDGRKASYARVFLLAMNAFFIMLCEIAIPATSGVLGRVDLSLQVQRIGQLFQTLLLFSLPLVIQDNMTRKTWRFAATRLLALVGLASIIVVAIAAFLSPDSFVSMKETRRISGYQELFGIRGDHGFIFGLRDWAITACLLASLVLLLAELVAKRSRETLLVLAGFVLATLFLLSDASALYAGRNLDPLDGIAFSRTPIGIGLLVVFCLFSELNLFARQKRELAAMVESLTASEERHAIMMESMSRFLPNEFITYMGKSSIEEVSLGDCARMHMTILFSDIRSFTCISERLTPEENFTFINEYLSYMVPVIRDYEGFIDKFIGDAIMALFPGGPDDAVRAALAMRQALARLNADRESRGQAPIDIGIGIHSGELMLGTVGDRYRMDGTVISDAVNLASRMESLTKVYDTPILMSEEAFGDLQNPAIVHSRFIGRSKVKGKSQPVSVFEIFGAGGADEIETKRKTHSNFERGVIALYTGKFREAGECFAAVIRDDPDDGAATYYLAAIRSRLDVKRPSTRAGVAT